MGKIVQPKEAKPYVYIAWPRMAFGPDGETVVCNDASEIPDGYLVRGPDADDINPKAKKAAPAKSTSEGVAEKKAPAKKAPAKKAAKDDMVDL